MDYKRYRFRLDQEDDKDRQVMEYIEREGRINSDEISDLLYKGIKSENSSVEGEYADLKNRLDQVELYMSELIEKLKIIEEKLEQAEKKTLDYKAVVAPVPEKKKWFHKSKSGKPENEDEQYKIQARKIEDYNGLLKYMAEKDVKKEIWFAVTTAVNCGLSDSEIISMIEDGMTAEQMNCAIEIMMAKKKNR